MKRFITFITLVVTIVFSSMGQKVGLVLSGGGAKGLYHVGIIKALEENNIPIDYVSGASMGAIVAGLYSIGYSADDMIRFFESDSVTNWLSGEIPAEYKYFFRKEGTTPEMVTINFKGLQTSTKGESSLKLPTSLISPYLLDLAFTSLLQGASWAAKENFDSLFIPLRCVASDVFNKKLVTFKSGSLPFAVRSSMTIPFVFKAMKRDSTLLYDGGIYNNFPWQCLEEDFHPDILIGGVCVGNNALPSEDDLIGQIMTIVTDSTDYSLPDTTKNLLIKRRFPDVGTLEYDRASYIIDKGYNDAIAAMPKIKERITRRVDPSDIKNRRDNFKRKIKPLIFDSVEITGVTDAQKSYILHQLGYLEQGEDYSLEYFIPKYLRMISAGVFDGSFPRVTYCPETERYQLHLRMTTKAEFKFSFGGNISSTSLNQLYLGVNYSHVNRLASSYYAGGLVGTFYNAFSVGGRHDLYTNFPFYFQYNYAWQQYDYTTNHMARYNKDNDSYLTRRIDNSINLNFGASAFSKYTFKINWSGGRSEYRFYPDVYVSKDKEDEMDFLYSKFDFQLTKNSLNYTLYPSLGNEFKADIRFISGIEDYMYSSGESYITGKNRSWFEAQVKYEGYYYLAKYFNLGFLAECEISDAPDFGTEFSSYFTRKQFSPTPHSQTMFMKEFRSASYLGLGIIPIFKFTKSQKFYLKTYAYCYLPQEVVYDDGWVTPTMDRIGEKILGIFGGSLVYQTPIGPASVSYNRYTTGPNNWSLMLNIGCALFKLNNE